MYSLVLSEQAKKDVAKLKKNFPSSYIKLGKLLLEISQLPRTGTGQVEQLKYLEEETYSRRISKKHRIVYRINDDKIEVFVVTTYGHYKDK